MLMHRALTRFLQIQRYQHGIYQGGHPIALVSMATTLCETRLYCYNDTTLVQHSLTPEVANPWMKQDTANVIDRFPNYCLGARRGKDLVAKGCYGPWRILLNVNPPTVCYSV